MNKSQLIIALAEKLRSRGTEIERILRTAPHRYKHYRIEKRTGGMRDIYHPTPELKAIQRWLVENIFSSIPVHRSVYSYKSDTNIENHASAHLENNYFLKLDFSDFFPSITSKWISDFLRVETVKGTIELEEDAIESIVLLTCRWSKEQKSFALSIGAPSSPALSNAVLFDLDEELSIISNQAGCTYTRYADDMYFSSREPNKLKVLEIAVRDSIVNLTPLLKLNEKKTLNTSRKRKILVTGLVITPQRNVSIGRDLKRQIKTEIYLWIQGNLAADKLPKLKGLVAYVYDVERVFYIRLEAKFGAERLSFLMRS